MIAAMSRRSRVCAYFTGLLALSPGIAIAQEACFERLDTGVDMTGWKPSVSNHHGPGTGWTVEDGALVGRQTGDERGGILMTEKVYKDVEVVFEVKIDWGCDSGFFFRTTAGDRAYQVNVDHLPESGVGTIWGESFAQELRAIPYFLTDMGNAAVPAPNMTPSFDLAQWPTIWKPTEFNEMRARVEGNPPHIQVWISGLQVMDFTDTMLRAEIEPEGPLAIQVHSDLRWIPGGTVSYRNIRVKDLTAPCNEPDPGTGGSGGAASTGGGAGAPGGAAAAGSAGQSASGASGAASGGSPSGASGSTSLSTAGSAGTPPASPAAPTVDSGCGCAVPVQDRHHGWAAAMLALGLVLRRARRRSLS
jgi:MYXO-CTERM domain-containing protein